jgi:hypothetical protein
MTRKDDGEGKRTLEGRRRNNIQEKDNSETIVDKRVAELQRKRQEND